MAVGFGLTTGQKFATLAERWNGAKWSIEPTAIPPTRQSQLNAVSCPSASACVAVGFLRRRGSPPETLAERWNGAKWSIEPTPNPPIPRSQLTAVSCASASACTAVGSMGKRALAERWNGAKWSITPTPAPGPQPSQRSELTAVSCVTATDCTAVGQHADNTLAERWDGTQWSIEPIRNPRTQAGGYSNLNAVSCPAASACIAVGYYYKRVTGVPSETLAERWNGRSWSITPWAAPHAPNILNGVSCVSAHDCAAVGTVGKQTLAARWDGTKWSIEPTPNAPIGKGGGSALAAVSCPAKTACIAVGDSNSSGYDQTATLAELWNR